MNTPQDPLAVIENLDEKEILVRLAELRAQRDALRILLRTARARNRARTAGQSWQEPGPSGETPVAS